MTAEQAKKTAYSPTALIQYGGGGLYIPRGCPAWYAAERIDSVDPIEGESCAEGRIYAHIVASYRKHCYRTGKPKDPDAMRFLVRDVFFEQTDVPAARYDAMLELCMCTAFRELLDLDAFLDAEQRCFLDINGYAFRGHPDLRYSRGNVIFIQDDKTGWHMPSREQVRADFQLECYAAMSLEEFKSADMATVFFRLPRLNASSETYTYTREDLVRIKDEIWHRIEQIETDIEFLPRPGSCCDFCGVKGACPALAKLVEDSTGGATFAPVVSDEQARDYAARLRLYAVLSKDIKARLKPYTETHRMVAASSDWGYGPHEATSISYGVQALFDVFEGSEVDPWSVLSVDRAALKRALKREPHLADAVGALARATTKTKTDLHKVKKAKGDS